MSAPQDGRRRTSRASGAGSATRAGRSSRRGGLPTSWRGAAAGRPRDAHGRAHHLQPRDRGADRPARPADLQRFGRVVPAVQRTGSGLRSGRPHHARDPRRRPLGDLGPEGVELHGDGRRLRHAPRAHGLRCPEARRHLVVRVPARPTGRDHPPPGRDHRARAVQRGVPRRRSGGRRRPHRRSQQRVGGHADHPDVRARGHRRRRDHERVPTRGTEGRVPPAARRRRGAAPAAGVDQQGVDRRRALRAGALVPTRP